MDFNGLRLDERVGALARLNPGKRAVGLHGPGQGRHHTCDFVLEQQYDLTPLVIEAAVGRGDEASRHVVAEKRDGGGRP
jgi:hypothetical protein